MAAITLDHLPEHVRDIIGDIVLRIDEFPEENLIDEIGLESPYDLLAFTGHIDAPDGAPSHIMMVLFRRPLLEHWCERGEDLMQVVAQTILDEIDSFFCLSDDVVDQLALN